MTTQKEPSTLKCSNCEEIIEWGEWYYNVDGKCYHEDCMSEFGDIHGEEK